MNQLLKTLGYIGVVGTIVGVIVFIVIPLFAK